MSMATALPGQLLLDGVPPSSLRLGYKTQQGPDSIRMNYRAANNDFLNQPIPGQEVSRFIMGELEAEYVDNTVHLDRVTAIDIVNLNTNPLPMNMTKEYSWGLKIDYAPRNKLCSDCSNFGLESKIGRSGRINDRILLYGLVGGRMHTPDSRTENYATMVTEAGTVLNVTDRVTAHASAIHYVNLVSGKPEYVASLDMSFNLRPGLDYRIGIDGNDDDAAFTGHLLFTSIKADAVLTPTHLRRGRPVAASSSRFWGAYFA